MINRDEFNKLSTSEQVVYMLNGLVPTLTPEEKIRLLIADIFPNLHPKSTNKDKKLHDYLKIISMNLDEMAKEEEEYIPKKFSKKDIAEIQDMGYVPIDHCRIIQSGETMQMYGAYEVSLGSYSKDRFGITASMNYEGETDREVWSQDGHPVFQLQSGLIVVNEEPLEDNDNEEKDDSEDDYIC